MNIIIISAIKNIKNSIVLNIIILLISIVMLLITHKIILSINEHKSLKSSYTKEFEVYKEGEDRDIFYFNDYEDNDIANNIESIYKEKGLITARRNIVFPASLILRNLSKYVVVSAYEDYDMLTNYLIEGNIFTSTNNSVIISQYLPLKTNDVFQLFIRDSLAGYKARAFFVSGIYSNINTNENIDYIDTVGETVIYTSLNTVSNFLYTTGSGKNPYFEKYILYFNDYVDIEKIINSFNIKDFVIEPIIHENLYSIEISKIYIIAALVSTIIATIFLIASLNYLQIQHRISLGYLREYKILSKRSQFTQIFFIDTIATSIYILILKLFGSQINFITAITSITILLSYVCSVLLSILRNYEYKDKEELK